MDWASAAIEMLNADKNECRQATVDSTDGTEANYKQGAGPVAYGHMVTS